MSKCEADGLVVVKHTAGDGFTVSHPGSPSGVHFRNYQELFVAKLSRDSQSSVTPKFVDIAEAIYGKDIAGLKGKATRAKPITVDPFLLTVTTPLGYKMVSQLVGSRSQSADVLFLAV